MADIVGASLSNIYNARSTYRSLAPPLATASPNIDIPSAAKTGFSSAPRIMVNRIDAATMLSVSLVTATAIVDALRQLVAAAKVATHDGLVDPYTNLMTNGDTRVSRLNISSGINLTLKNIDNLISEAEFSNANLISSTSPDFYIQTTKFGGKISVTPQPLDRASLGLEDINLIFKPDDRNGFIALSKAYSTAQDRLSVIQQLHRLFVGGSSLDTSLQSLISQYQNTTLPTGTFVDMKA